jgi:tRNA A-37 threonylcarbamoyl transferase component Bud32
MPDTRSQDAADTPKTYVLDFFCDEQDGCALSVRINDVRFHIVVDSARLKSKDDHRLFRQYQQRLRAVKRKESQQDDDDDDGDSKGSSDRDSGIDVSGDQTISAAETELQNWILSCFGNETAKLAPADASHEEMLLEEWYNTPVYYYEVVAEDGELRPSALEESVDLRKRMDDLFPSLPVPKKLRELPIDSTKPQELKVLETSDEPSPIHPSLVRWSKDNQTYFFKAVDPSQPQPTKREIQTHHEIQKKNLDDKFRVPKLHALVYAPGSKVEIMGILLTVIEDPTPLTRLLDSEVDEGKRRQWAKESERIVKVLHDNDIVWGDAKADNFVVDKSDNLWIIDFGGSYTEGWIDPENMETEEGDNEATEKIVNALKDPENATIDMEEEQEAMKRKDSDEKQGETTNAKKRKREEEAPKIDAQQAQPASKVKKTVEFVDALAESKDNKTYCNCDGFGAGEMVGCENRNCSREWYHLSCLGLDKAPKEDDWYCPDCRGNQRR